MSVATVLCGIKMELLLSLVELCLDFSHIFLANSALMELILCEKANKIYEHNIYNHNVKKLQIQVMRIKLSLIFQKGYL